MEHTSPVLYKSIAAQQSGAVAGQQCAPGGPVAVTRFLQTSGGNQATGMLIQRAYQGLPPPTDGQPSLIRRPIADHMPAPSPQPGVALPISAPDDPSEHEAETIADQIMQAPTGSDPQQPAPAIPLAARVNPSREERPGGTFGLPPAASRAIQRPSSGNPLPGKVRAFLEPRFGVDFGAVRTHTGPEAGQLARDLHAQAFTYGQHIWLGQGENPDNLPLMAHELTHVLQQTPAVARSVTMIQRTTKYYSLRSIPGFSSPGTRTHQLLMGDSGITGSLFGGLNTDLFTEVNIPGGNRYSLALGIWGERVVGRTDFYKANTTIGVEFISDETEPRFLPSHRTLRRGGAPYSHAKLAAPAGKTGAPDRVCSAMSAPGVCRMKAAPVEIKFGDLKPADIGERRLGGGQLDNYIKGVSITADKVRQFARAHPSRVEPIGSSWRPHSGKMSSGDIAIPSGHKALSTSGPKFPVVAYINGKQVRYADVRQAYLYVYYDNSNPGIWYYEYVPIIPLISGASLSGTVQPVLNQLNSNVVQPLKSQPKIIKSQPEVNLKVRPGTPRAHLIPRPLATHRIQRRAADGFQLADWQRDRYLPWRDGRARPFLRERHKEIGQIAELEVLLAVRQRTGAPIGLPEQAPALTKGLRHIQSWAKYGGIYGRLRHFFGGTYVRVVNFYERARERFRQALERRRARGGAGGFLGTVIRTAFAMLKQFAGMILGQVVERLVQALRNGAEVLLRSWFNPEIEAVEAQIQQVQHTISGFEEAVRQDFLAAVESIVGPFEQYLETVENVRRLISNIGRIINLIKWGARIAACGVPPLLGCLWGVIGTTALEGMAELVAASCWFKREVMFPIISQIEFVRRLPQRIANFILDRIRTLLPVRLRPLLGEVSTAPTTLEASQVECGGSGVPSLAGDHQALINLYERHGEQRVQTFFRSLRQQGTPANTLLTAERTRQYDANLTTSAVGMREQPTEARSESTAQREGKGHERARAGGGPIRVQSERGRDPRQTKGDSFRFPFWIVSGFHPEQTYSSNQVVRNTIEFAHNDQLYIASNIMLVFLEREDKHLDSQQPNSATVTRFRLRFAEDWAVPSIGFYSRGGIETRYTFIPQPPGGSPPSRQP